MRPALARCDLSDGSRIDDDWQRVWQGWLEGPSSSVSLGVLLDLVCSFCRTCGGCNSLVLPAGKYSRLWKDIRPLGNLSADFYCDCRIRQDK